MTRGKQVVLCLEDVKVSQTGTTTRERALQHFVHFHICQPLLVAVKPRRAQLHKCTARNVRQREVLFRCMEQ